MACETLGFHWLSEAQRRALVRVLRGELTRTSDRQRLLQFARRWLYEHRLIVLRDRDRRTMIIKAIREHEAGLARTIVEGVDPPLLALWRAAVTQPHESGTTVRKNQLLAALPEAELQRWQPHLEYVKMRLSEVLYESGGTLAHAYFPTTAIVSLLNVSQNGASAEIAVVGYEGILGVPLFMGGGSTPSRAVVQSAGHGFRLRAQLMKDEFDRAGPVLHLLLRYTQALITQLSQTAVCNRHHSLDQQLCRWLLLS